MPTDVQCLGRPGIGENRLSTETVLGSPYNNILCTVQSNPVIVNDEGNQDLLPYFTDNLL